MKASNNFICLLFVFFTIAQFLQAQQRVSSINEDNPNLPKELSFLQDLTLPSGWGTNGASTDGRYLYVPVQNRELHVYDMLDPSSPQLVSNIQDAGSPGTLLEGSFYHNKMLYFTDSGKKLYVYDCDDPTNLILKNSTSVDGTISAMSFNGNYAYTLMPFPTGLTGKSRFTIFDISNPQTPIKKSSVDIIRTGGGGKNLHLSANRNLVYIKSNSDNANGSIYILDVSDPQSPIVSSITNRAMTYDDLILGYDDYFIVSQIDNKKTILHVYSTTNPINPQLIKSYELPGSKEIKGMTDIEGTILVYCWPFNSKTISTFYYDKEINEFTAGPEITDTKGWGTHDFVILKEPITRLGKLNKSNSIQDYSSNNYYAVYANGSPPVRVIKLEYRAEIFTITTEIQPEKARLAGCWVKGGGTYLKNQIAELYAVNTDVESSGFDTWGGDINSTDNPVSIVVKSDMHIIANYFYPNPLGIPFIEGIDIYVPKPPDTAASVITIRYKDNSDNEDGFKVERQINEDGWNEIGATEENITTYEDADTELDGTYSYRVCAYNSAGKSEYSNIANIEVKNTTIPNAPSLLSVNIVETKPPDTAATVITIKYKDESDNEDGFKVERQINEEGWKEIGTTGENITSYKDTDTELDGTYLYRVCAYNSAGNSDYSNIASVEVKKTTIPNAPNLLIVRRNYWDNQEDPPDGVDTIAWINSLNYKDNSDNEDGFRVERQINEEGWNEIGATEENITTYEDTDTELEGTYSYRVCAYNSAGKSDYSNTGTILVTKIQDDNSIPVKYTMLQNFPNPFNPTTMINYSIPLVSHVSLKVYDILGREVAVLVNREQLPGNYKIEFNAGKLASGIYIYRINAGKFNDAKKLILIK